MIEINKIHQGDCLEKMRDIKPLNMDMNLSFKLPIQK
jgi:hypothetical protein